MALVEVGGSDLMPATAGHELREILRNKSTAVSFFYPIPFVGLALAGVIAGQIPVLPFLAIAPLTLITPLSIWAEAKLNHEESNRKRRAMERKQARVRKESIELAALSSRHAITDLRDHPISEGDLSLALDALKRVADVWDSQPVQPHDKGWKRLQTSLERAAKSCGMILEDPNLLATETEYYELVDAMMSVTQRLENAVFGSRNLCAPALVIDNNFAPPVHTPVRIAA
jgi:hypothetical protein